MDVRSIKNFFNYCNPFEDSFKALNMFSEISLNKKLTILAVTALGSLLSLGIGTVGAFRWATQKIGNVDIRKITKVVEKTLPPLRNTNIEQIQTPQPTVREIREEEFATDSFPPVDLMVKIYLRGLSLSLSGEDLKRRGEQLKQYIVDSLKDGMPRYLQEYYKHNKSLLRSITRTSKNLEQAIADKETRERLQRHHLFAFWVVQQLLTEPIAFCVKENQKVKEIQIPPGATQALLYNTDTQSFSLENL